MYIHIASTYRVITLFAGDIWLSEVTVQDFWIQFQCVDPRGDALLLSELLVSFIFFFLSVVVSAIFSTQITECLSVAG